ncbi:MAG: CHAT domain-containing protein [Brasilonema angustatum HA4187-MV1]|nr:CHAT domain-containing protein [Brasilonema angustatum HA4187-MV1]
MVITCLLCITSPILAQTPVTSTLIAQSQSGLTLEQQARSRYSANQFTEAATLFQQAALAYKAAGNPIRQALSLSNLSLCYQQLGQWNDASKAIADSLALLEATIPNTSEKSLALAQVLDIQGGLLLARGQTEAALKSWERATLVYTQLGKPDKALISQVNQAQALQNLGLYRRAIALLQTALKLPQRSTTNTETITNAVQLKTLESQLQGISASPETATALRTLGDSLRVTGNLTQARLVLERSLAMLQQGAAQRAIATKLQLSDIITLTQLSLGNTARAQLSLDKTDETPIDPQAAQAALKFYQQAASTVSPHLRVQAQVNQFSLLVDSNQQSAAQTFLPQVQQQIEALPPSRTAIEARVNLAQSMMRMESQKKGTSSLLEALLTKAVQQAKDLGDSHTLAYALGSLGNVYEKMQQWSQAEKLTSQALQLAQQSNADDSTYLWQWQLGRVLKAQGKNTGAIAAYKEAVATIKSLRTDLAAASPDLQFSFRYAVEPIHRQLVGLLVNSNKPDDLKVARDVIEALQLVELDNFFREACLNGNPALIDQVDQRAAVIYPILLEDQLAIITSLPQSASQKSTKESHNLRYKKTDVSSKEVENLVSTLRGDLQQNTTGDLALPELQKLYNWLIRPVAAELAASKVETLVFVLDGALRNIPMAALHDGQKFLVEQYSIALTPGLQLLSPRSLKQEQLGALVAGLNAARPPAFPSLPYVETEVNKIKSEIPTQILFNQKFTNTAFQNRVSAVSSPIVHLATHGQFGSTADDTFILTWDGKIKVNQLSSVLKTVELSRKNSLELLVLSACETAAGDTRSALGLAGVAVRSGARSTVATLWRVNDEASATLIGQFYDQLAHISKTGISKAEALRRAQLAILKDRNYRQQPYYWAAYVLIGNWT